MVPSFSIVLAAASRCQTPWKPLAVSNTAKLLEIPDTSGLPQYMTIDCAVAVPRIVSIFTHISACESTGSQRSISQDKGVLSCFVNLRSPPPLFASPKLKFMFVSRMSTGNPNTVPVICAPDGEVLSPIDFENCHSVFATIAMPPDGTGML